MNYEIIITPSAKADLFETRLWLLENRGEYADRWLWKITVCINSLRKMPKRCPVSVENDYFDEEVREKLCGEKRNVYRILFSIREDTVFILRVRSTRQQRLIDSLEDE